MHSHHSAPTMVPNGVSHPDSTCHITTVYIEYYLANCKRANWKYKYVRLVAFKSQLELNTRKHQPLNQLQPGWTLRRMDREAYQQPCLQGRLGGQEDCQP